MFWWENYLLPEHLSLDLKVKYRTTPLYLLLLLCLRSIKGKVL